MSKTRTLLGSLAAGALVASLALPAFAQSDAPIPIEGAEGQTWQLLEQSVDGTMTAVPDDVVVTLLLQDGQAGGNGGCNSYFASYTLGTTSLTFGPVVSTFMFCEGPGGDVETAYFANLAASPRGPTRADSSSSTMPQGEPILDLPARARRHRPRASRASPGSSGRAGRGALAPLPSGPDGGPVLVTLLLQDGRSGGTGGCNTYFADYTLDGSGLSFGPIGSTLMVLRGGRQRRRGGLLRQPRQRGQLGVGWHLAQPHRRDGTTVLEFTAAPAASVLGRLGGHRHQQRPGWRRDHRDHRRRSRRSSMRTAA